MVKMPKISACLVVYNEEKVIRRCLDSLKGAVDEIILVHDGPCTDRTLEIAAKYTRKIFTRPRVGEAEPHRMFSFSKARGDWVLQIDADEFLSGGLRKNLRNLVSSAPASVSAFSFACEMVVSGSVMRRIGLGKAYHLCLFRNGKVKYQGLFHEIPEVSGKTETSELLLHHRQPFDNYTFSAFSRKWIPWARKQAAFSISRGRSGMPAILYLPKAIFVFLFYVGYFFIPKLGFLNGFAGLKISLLQGLYNFFVCWYTFVFKIRGIGGASG